MVNLLHDGLKYLVIWLLFFSCRTLSGQADSTSVIHVVLYGDNLFRLSLKYGVSVDQIKEWNSLGSNAIKENQRLIVGYQSVAGRSSVTGQKATSGYLGRLNELVDRVEVLYYELLTPEFRQKDSLVYDELKSLFSGQYGEVSQYELLRQMNETRIRSLQEDIGLGFYSGFTHNFRPGVFDGEDLLFQNRASMGLDWRVLKEGLSGNRDAINRLRIENELNELLQVKDAKNNNYVYHYNFIIYLFNQTQQKYLERRLSVINSFLDLASQMYLVRAMPWEKIIDLKSKKEALETMSRNLTNYNKGFDSAYQALFFDRSVDAARLPILEILPDRVFSGVGMDTLTDRVLALNRQRLEIDYKKTKDLALRTYVRYNLFDGVDSDLRTFGSVGATFTAPLFRNKRNDQLKEVELAVVKSQMESELTTVNNELMNHYYEYEYTLKQFIEFYGKKELALEMLRRELTRDYLKDPEFTPIDAIGHLDQLFAIEFDLLDLKQKLYLKLLKIYSLLDIENLEEITYPLDFGDLFDKMAGKRAVYVWSETLLAQDREFIARYAVNNEFDRVFISQGQLNDESVLPLVGRLQKEKVQVYKLVGNNDLARTSEHQDLIDLARKAIEQGYAGIQLDVEPHTFTDWKQKEGEYLSNLSAAIAGLKRAGDDRLSISVSLPLFYPEAFIRDILPYADELVLMCYERPEVDFIVRQISEELRLAGEKVTLALRTEDFEDRLVLEDFARKIISATGINNLVLHDLGSLMKLDQKTILAR